jgi:hypothetical protein
MATISAVSAAHATLTATTVDTVTLSARAGSVTAAPLSVRIANETPVGGSGAANIYVRTGGATGASVTTPTVAGNDSYSILPGETITVPFGGALKLISSGTPAYSAEIVVG